MRIAITSQTVYTHTNTLLRDGVERYRMTRRQTDPLRPLTAEEQTSLERLARSQSEPASHVARAKALLAVAAGQRSTAAAQAARRRSGDAVAPLGTRFNQHGLVPQPPWFDGFAQTRLSLAQPIK